MVSESATGQGPFEPVANVRFGGHLISGNNGKTVAVRADLIRPLRFSGVSTRAAGVALTPPLEVDIASHSSIQGTQGPDGVAIENVGIGRAGRR